MTVETQARRIPSSTRQLCATCLKNGFQVSDCIYCGAMLSPRHEHDHMPIPFRAGGVEVAPVCINCHDLKDRSHPGQWNQDAFRKALDGAPALARIAIALLLAEVHTLKAERDEARAA